MDRFQISNLNLHFKKLKKKNKLNPKQVGRKETLKPKWKKKKKYRKTIEKINENKSLFFKKVTKLTNI